MPDLCTKPIKFVRIVEIIMDRKALLILFTVLCTLIIQAESYLTVFDKSFKNRDVFQSIEINTYELLRSSKIRKLNDFLVDRSDSPDPHVNLDIILEELLKDYKNLVYSNSKTIEAKRLILSLKTINEENECSFGSLLILKNNLDALGTSIRSIITNSGLRRIDKILAYYINKHVNKCREVYFTNLDYFLYNDLSSNKLKSVDLLVKTRMVELTSDENPDNKDKTYVERLYHAVTTGISSTFALRTEDIYSAMEGLIKGDLDEKFFRVVENEKTGSHSITEDKFKRLFYKYVVEPCNYYRLQLGPNIFEPALFDSRFDHQIRTDRVDYYEFWLKYRLCAAIDEAFGRVLGYANRVR